MTSSSSFPQACSPDCCRASRAPPAVSSEGSSVDSNTGKAIGDAAAPFIKLLPFQVVAPAGA